MRIILEDKGQVLKEIELSTLHLKAIQLSGEKPEDYFSHKIERILKFAVDQAKQVVDRISPLSDAEMENIIDKIEEEKRKLDKEHGE